MARGSTGFLLKAFLRLLIVLFEGFSIYLKDVKRLRFKDFM